MEFLPFFLVPGLARTLRFSLDGPIEDGPEIADEDGALYGILNQFFAVRLQEFVEDFQDASVRGICQEIFRVLPEGRIEGVRDTSGVEEIVADEEDGVEAIPEVSGAGVVERDGAFGERGRGG